MNEVRTYIHKAQSRIAALEAENAKLEALFDLRHEADMRGIAKWRAENPDQRNLMQPDHAELVAWLLNRVDALEAENAKLREAISHYSGSLGSETEKRCALEAALNGYKAYCRGEPVTACPSILNQNASVEWVRGWKKAEQEEKRCQKK